MHSDVMPVPAACLCACRMFGGNCVDAAINNWVRHTVEEVVSEPDKSTAAALCAAPKFGE